jgi:hypothetical protein
MGPGIQKPGTVFGGGVGGGTPVPYRPTVGTGAEAVTVSVPLRLPAALGANLSFLWFLTLTKGPKFQRGYCAKADQRIALRAICRQILAEKGWNFGLLMSIGWPKANGFSPLIHPHGIVWYLEHPGELREVCLNPPA